MIDNDLILVDQNDNAIGFGEKLDVHKKELLHRAFSIFIYDRSDNTMLLQRRAFNKYHSGGLWTNACCSHPRRGESMQEALNHRLNEELGFNRELLISDSNSVDSDESLVSCGKFYYYARYEGLSEHEIDHVYLYNPQIGGIDKKEIKPNPDEVYEVAWISLEKLDEWLEGKPEEFTAWFANAYQLVKPMIKGRIQ